MKYGNPDRVPYFEEGIREDVLRSWVQQGMPEGLFQDSLIQSDNQEELAPEIGPIPNPTRWPTSVSELDLLRERLDPQESRRLPHDWSQRVSAWRNREHVLMVRVHRGLFQSLGIRDWHRFSEVIYLLKDNPNFVRQALAIQSEFVVKLLQSILAEVELEAAIFSEPIGGNSGPLVSPQMYEDLVLPSYAPIVQILKDHGVDTIIFRTYANSRILIPSIVKWGFNCLWACEVDVEAMDYGAIRAEFGRDLRLIGGIDLDTLLESKEAIRREIVEKVPPLIADGGYIPLADGRVRATIPYERYLYYRQMLEDIILANS